MKVAICVKEVPEAAAPRRIDPQTQAPRALRRARPQPVRRARDRGGAPPARRRAAAARSSSCRWGPSGPPRRCAARSRSAPTARCSSPTTRSPGSDLLATTRVLAAVDRARAARPRPPRPAGGGVGRRRPLGRARGAARAALRLAGDGAHDRRRHRAGEAPDGVRLRHDRDAASRRHRGLGRDQRAPLPVAQGDHGRQVEAAGAAHLADLGCRARGGRRGGLAHDGARAGRAAARAATRASSRTATGGPRRSWTSSRSGSSYEDPRLRRAPRRHAPARRARRARRRGRAGGGATRSLPAQGVRGARRRGRRARRGDGPRRRGRRPSPRRSRSRARRCSRASSRSAATTRSSSRTRSSRPTSPPRSPCASRPG